MKIQINDKKFHTDDLIELIARNKLQAIIHIRSVTNIGLKDAKEIVENLEENPNYYNNSVLRITEREFNVKESITLDYKQTTDIKLNRDKKVGSHIIKNENPNKIWIYAIGLLVIIALIYFLVLE